MALTKVVRHLSSTPSIVDGGNATAITIDSSENISLASHVQVADNKNLKFGDDTDAQLYYNSSNDIFYIYNSGANGGTIIQNNSASGGIVLQPVPNENAVFCAPNGEVILYHNSSAKLTTTSTGITVTGAITGTLASTVTATTQSAGTNSTLIATTAYTDAAITALVGGAPATLDTLNEIAASVNDDANYVGTVNSLLAAKAPLASPTFTGTVTTSGNLDINGNQLILDADADTSIRESADDYLIMKVGGTDLIKIDASGLGIGIRPAEMLDIQSASGDARIRLDAPAGSDTEVKFFNAGSAQYTIGHDDGTDNFVIGGANVDAPYVNVTKAGYVGIGITDPSDYYAKNLVVNSGAEGGITIVGGTGHVNYLMFADGTSGNTQYRGYIEYSHITDGMKLNTAGTPALTLDISQNAIFTNDIKFTSDAGGNIGLNSGNRPNNISMAGGLGVNAAAGGAGTIAFSGDITQAQGDYLYSGGTNFDIKHTVASQNIIISTRPSGGSITPRMRITHDGKFGMGDTPSNLTSEIITITTPASGGGQGIAFKRLDSNNDQTVGQIRFSNNATDNLAYIRCITDGDTTSSRLEFHTNTGSATAANLVIKKNGNVAINYGLGGGAINSKFNVFADGEALRLDGTANTSRTLRFRNAAVNGSGNAIITSDGILQIKTEDANAHIYVNSVRDIAMQVTSLNGTAGHFTFSSYNTEIMRIDGANNRVGIGTGANPNLKLHVEENADTWVGEFKNVRGAGGYGLRVDMSAGSATDTRYALGVYTPGNSGLFVRNNGNVGIGTTAPSVTLVVQRSTANIEPILVIKNDNTTDDNGVSIDFSGKDTSSNHVIYGRIATKYTNHSTEKSHMIFTHRNNSGTFDEWMRVNHDGQVGIGTASPSSALHVHENDSAKGNTQLHIHNDKTDDAGVLRIEGKRISENDTAQILLANNGNLVSAIKAYSGGDGGHLRFYTSKSGSGSSAMDERLRLHDTGVLEFKGSDNTEGIKFGSNQRIYGGTIRAFEPAMTSDGTVSIGEGLDADDGTVSIFGVVNIREQLTSPGGGVDAGEFISYMQGTGWTDILNIHFSNASWGSITINVQFPGNSSGSDSVFQQVTAYGHAALTGANVSYSDISGEGTGYFNWVSFSGGTKLQLKTQYSTDDAAVRISYTMNHRTSQNLWVERLA